MDHHNPDRSIAKRFAFSITLTAVTLVAEVAGGLWTHSLALLSDAAHVFLDLFALLLSLAAIKLAALPATETRTYGWHRVEVFASFINGVTVFLIALGIFHEAAGRFGAPVPVDSVPMFAIAVIGLVMNLLAAKLLHEHSGHDLNVRSAFLHVIGDAAASVGVIVGGIVMYFSQWYVVDAIMSVGIGCVVLAGAWRVIRESTHILLEGVPRGVSVPAIADGIRSVDGVKDVHHLNVWSICSHILALSAHVDVDESSKRHQGQVLHAIEHLLLDRFNISHTTIQMECVGCGRRPVIKALDHSRTRHSHDHGH